LISSAIFKLKSLSEKSFVFMVSLSPLVALPCKLSPGGFSGERIFEVILADGQPYRSIAPRQFCWNSDNSLVEENEPQNEIGGMVAARVVDFIEGEQVIVEVPDGEIIAVDKGAVQKRPTSIKSAESNPHVPV
jgi:hypothetical protein